MTFPWNHSLVSNSWMALRVKIRVGVIQLYKKIIFLYNFYQDLFTGGFF